MRIAVFTSRTGRRFIEAMERNQAFRDDVKLVYTDGDEMLCRKEYLEESH